MYFAIPQEKEQGGWVFFFHLLPNIEHLENHHILLQHPSSLQAPWKAGLLLKRCELAEGR